MILGLDLGTSSLKALAMDARGRVLAVTERGHDSIRHLPGWHEQSPLDWERGLNGVLTDLRERGVPLERVVAIGVSGQMHGLVLLDGVGEPLGPCQTWADSRCGAEARRVERRVGRARLIALAGSRANTSATASKLLWVRRYKPGRWQMAAHVLLPKDYLRWRLTGVIATDPTDACGTLLADVHGRAWSQEILDALDIPASLLPRIVESTSVAGRVSAESAGRYGLPGGVPVVAGAGDAECAAVGHGLTGCVESDGTVLVSIGTAAQLFVVTGQPVIDPQGRVQTLCHAVTDRWHMMGAILSGASALDWLARIVSPSTQTSATVQALLDEASREPAGARGVIFLPHLAGTRMPDMNPHARGVFVGLRPEHTRGTLARAAIEGVALALGEGLDVARELGLRLERLRLAGGAFRHPLWARVVANVCGLPASTDDAPHASALGAARLAAAGIGLLSLDEPVGEPNAPEADVVQPDAHAHAVYVRLGDVSRALTSSLRGAFRSLDMLT